MSQTLTYPTYPFGRIRNQSSRKKNLFQRKSRVFMRDHVAKMVAGAGPVTMREKDRNCEQVWAIGDVDHKTNPK
jgi:hypothetical protein